MAVVNRQFTYKRRIKVSVEDLEGARVGRRPAPSGWESRK